MMPDDETNQLVMFTYTNYKGETAERSVYPIGIRFDKNEWHPEEQWLLDAWDVDKDAHRTFAMKDITNWKSAIEE